MDEWMVEWMDGWILFSRSNQDPNGGAHILWTLYKVDFFYISAVIGKSLLDTVTYEQRFGPRMVPILVQKCVEFIKEHGLDEEGIFRLPGQDNTVKQFRDAFDAGERPSFPRLDTVIT